MDIYEPLEIEVIVFVEGDVITESPAGPDWGEEL